ncbi:MAG: hypothetical protein KCHDKBKB_02154 [Elusimicrobia bacterium]|nr:hypothetical protein [Elusimicrobiota bacterium]
MKKRLLIIAFGVAVVTYLTITSYPIQMGWWMFKDFVNPKLTEQTESAFRKKSSAYLLRKLKSKVYAQVDIAEFILRERKENRAIPILIELTKSKNKTIRSGAIQSLGFWQDEKAIDALNQIVRIGQSQGSDYLNALYALSQAHHDPIYPEILNMAKNGSHTSWVVELLEHFPEKPETLPALKKIAEQDPESYVRDKARKAIEKIQASGGKSSASVTFR